MKDDDMVENMVDFLLSSGVITSNGPSQDFTQPITLKNLVQQADELKKRFPPMPPYYRVNQQMYDSLRRMCAVATDTVVSLTSVELRIDNKIPDGVMLPPEGYVAKE